MTLPKSASEDVMPPSRAVRWVLLAGVILFAVGLYFRFGLRVPPTGSAPPASATSTTSTP
jgi:hypothetical protein